jgi:magnesium chelatase family protein
MIQRYRSRISGPLLDRIDIHVEVPAVKYKDLTGRSPGEASAAIRERINRARDLQLARFKGTHYYCNAQMGARELRDHCQVEAAGERLLEMAINRLGLSARAYTRITLARRFNIVRSIECRYEPESELDSGGGPVKLIASEGIACRIRDRSTRLS